jgi:hypothetical protein
MSDSDLKTHTTEKVRTALKGDLVEAGSLDLGRDTDELLPDGILAACVHHLLSDRGIIGGPAIYNIRTTSALHA